MPSTTQIIEAVDTATDVLDHAVVAAETVSKLGRLGSSSWKRNLLVAVLVAAAVAAVWKYAASRRDDSTSVAAESS